MKNLWQKSYQNHLVYSENETEGLIEKFKHDALKIFAKRNEYANLKKYFEYVVEYQVNQIRNGVYDEISEQKENVCNKAKVLIKPLDKTIIKEHVNKTKKEIISNMSQFELSHMLRGHSKDNNIEDSTTSVNDAAFELAKLNKNLLSKSVHTNLCATCGHNIINLIDVESGKILQRFVDDMVFNKTKDVKFIIDFFNQMNVLF